MQLHDSLSITIFLAVSQPKVKPDHNSHHQLVFNRVANPPNQSQMLLSRAAWYNYFNFPRPTPKQLNKKMNTNFSAKSSNHKNESHDHCFALPNSHINSTTKSFTSVWLPSPDTWIEPSCERFAKVGCNKIKDQIQNCNYITPSHTTPK